MKALSLKQPYANLVAQGVKTIETRKWSTNYRGDILICASKSGQGEPQGVALCIVELYDIRPMTKADESAACINLYPNAKAWLIRNLRPIKEPFAVKGQLGLFELNLPEIGLLL
jgi:hypothetical protein